MHQPKDNLKGEQHSLFITKQIQIQQHFKLFVSDFFEQKNDIHDVYDKLLNAQEYDTLELRIASPGGLVTECQMFVNIIRNKFKGRTIGFIDSHASSAGAFTFCACDKRVVYENSRLMLHNYSGGLQGDHSKMKNRMDFDTKHTIGFLKSTLKIGKKGYLTKKEFNRMVTSNHEWWFDAQEMLKRGIATHIMIDGVEFTAKDYLKEA